MVESSKVWVFPTEHCHSPGWDSKLKLYSSSVLNSGVKNEYKQCVCVCVCVHSQWSDGSPCHSDPTEMQCPEIAYHTQQVAFHYLKDSGLAYIRHTTCTIILYLLFFSVKLGDPLLEVKRLILKVRQSVEVVKLVLSRVKVSKFTLNHVADKLRQCIIWAD